MATLKRHAWIALLGLLALPLGAPAEDRYFDSNGVTIRYVEYGLGEPVLLVHGGGATLEMWTNRGIAQELARTHRVIALDLRGHGQSGKPADVGAYGGEMARDIVRLLDHLGIEQVHIVGFSLGAFVASYLTTLHPERLLTATLVAGGGVLSPAERTEAEQILSRTEQDCVARARTAGAVGASEEAACAAVGAAAVSMTEILVSAEEAGSVRVPTLAVVGSLDTLPLGMQELKRVRPDVELVIVEGATHGLGPSDTRAVVRAPELMTALREMLARHTRLDLDGAVFEPSRDDPRIVAVIETMIRAGAGIDSGDHSIFAAHLAEDLIVNAPIGRVVGLADVLERLRAGEIAYTPGRSVTKIELAGVRDGLVVVMGEQIVYPTQNAPNAGRTVRRRFTDISKSVDGVWKLVIRQATVTSVE